MSESASDGTDYWETHPHATDEDIRQLCEAWIRYQAKGGIDGADDDDPDWWGVQVVTGVYGLELHWRIVSRLCSLTDPTNASIVGAIGAGPLEDFIAEEGDHAMDLIEPSAERDPVLLAALGSVCVWNEPVRPRLQRYLAVHGQPRD
jgi:hypothetical protein